VIPDPSRDRPEPWGHHRSGAPSLHRRGRRAVGGTGRAAYGPVVTHPRTDWQHPPRRPGQRPDARRGQRVPVLAIAAIASALLAGCTGPSSAPDTPPASSAPASAPGLPAPVIVEPEQTTASARVGETIVFRQPDPAATTISTDRPDILELTQGSDDGSAQFNPAAKALSAGVAVVTITAADGSTSQVTVTVR